MWGSRTLAESGIPSFLQNYEVMSTQAGPYGSTRNMGALTKEIFESVFPFEYCRNIETDCFNCPKDLCLF